METKKVTKQLSECVSQYKVLSKERELEIGRKIQEDPLYAEEGKTLLVLSNIRLVISMASPYGGSAEIHDLITEGVIGLQIAAERFDPAFNVRFASYASRWVKRRLVKFVADSQIIRLPEHSYQKYCKIADFIFDQSEIHGESPSLENISKKFKVSVGQLESIFGAKRALAYLNAKADGESSREIGDEMIHPSGENPQEMLLLKEDLQVCKELLAVLSDKEKIVIECRFGLNSNDEQTLESIGVRLNLTRERIRQIEFSALRKMREHSSRFVEINV